MQRLGCKTVALVWTTNLGVTAQQWNDKMSYVSLSNMQECIARMNLAHRACNFVEYQILICHLMPKWAKIVSSSTFGCPHPKGRKEQLW